MTSAAGPQERSKVPVTLLTGFLGAGKTTRLNATLAAGTQKIAVIENELGALSVDGALVANRHDDGVIELNNGCLCCSAEVDLISALEGLARRRDERPFDHVVVETTGLADVAPVVAFLRDQEDPLFEDYYFSGVVTVVNAANLKPWLSSQALDSEDAASAMTVARATGFGMPSSLSGTEAAALLGGPQEQIGLGRQAALAAFWRQVALADRMVVSKADLLADAEEEVKGVCAVLAATNPLADVIVDNCSPAGPLPLDVNDARSEVLGAIASSMASSTKRASSSAQFCKRQRPNTGSTHLAGVDALTLRLESDELLEEESLRAVVRELLDGGDRRAREASMGEAWRVKGVLPVAGIGAALLQGVGDQVELGPWLGPIDRSSGAFIVVIGEGIDIDRIRHRLAACVSEKRPAPLQ